MFKKTSSTVIPLKTFFLSFHFVKEFDAQLLQLTWILIRQFPPKHEQQPLSFKLSERKLN